MFHMWNTGGLPYKTLCLTDLLLNDSVSLFTQYHVNSISKSIPCIFSGTVLLLGIIHFKTTLATLCMQAYIAFFTHGFGIFLHILQHPREASLWKWFIFIKSHVLWKFSFSFWYISGFLLCFKQAKSHWSPKL